VRRKLLLRKTALPKQRSTRELAWAFSEDRRAEARMIAISIPIPIITVAWIAKSILIGLLAIEKGRSFVKCDALIRRSGLRPIDVHATGIVMGHG
jgi:hypothetical protein